MRAVNLLPRDERRSKTLAEQLPVFVGVGSSVLVTLLLAVGFLLSSATVKDKESTLGQLEDQVRLLPKPPEPPSPVEAGLVGEQTARVNALSSALSRRVAWDRVLRQVAMVLPDDVWLTSVSAKSPASPASAAPAPPAPASAAPTQFVVAGYTYSHAGVARLLSRLSVLPELLNVQLQSSTLSKLGPQPIVSFTILADVRPPGATS